MISFSKKVDQIKHQEVLDAYGRLTAMEQEVYDQMRASVDEPFNPMTRFSANNFQHYNVPDSGKGTDEKIAVCGCYPIGSRFNHSCRPNCDFGIREDGTLVCRANRDIRPHEELTIAYSVSPLYLTTTERQIYFQRVDRHHFRTCLCDPCALQPDDESRKQSDARRLQLRQLSELVGTESSDDVVALSNRLKLPAPQSVLDAETMQMWRNKKPEVLYSHIAELHEVEGIAAGELCIESYRNAAQSMVQRARADGDDRLQGEDFQNFRAWTTRMREHIAIFSPRLREVDSYKGLIELQRLLEASGGRFN